VTTPAEEWHPMQLSVASICVVTPGLTGAELLLSIEVQTSGFGT
jgi:hypothetical protein